MLLQLHILLLPYVVVQPKINMSGVQVDYFIAVLPIVQESVLVFPWEQIYQCLMELRRGLVLDLLQLRNDSRLVPHLLLLSAWLGIPKHYLFRCNNPFHVIFIV